MEESKKAKLDSKILALPGPPGLGLTAARARGAAQGENAEFLDQLEPDPKFVSEVPISFARRHGLLALGGEGESVLAGREDSDPDAIDATLRLLPYPAELRFAPPAALERAINRAYERRSGEAEMVIEELEEEDGEESALPGLREDLLESEGRAPVIRLVSGLLFEAIRSGSSDLHIQPYEDTLLVRFRIDGVLFDVFELSLTHREEIASRVKVLGGMNIAERRLPQDGRATVRVGERVIDLRISSVPTSHGERVVIRLLDKSARLYSLEELGMSRETYERFRKLISVEHGLILVTGPTGSGKSTTLYAALKEINSKERNILTLEDPIEYGLEGISQIGISGRKGMTFASGLRSVLRQDPDIIMVGEIRDRETAVLAIQSALTGHLVFSTLHTNDAASAVTRLLDLGIEPYLVSSSLVGVMAQRLVRRVCESCAKNYEPSPGELEDLGVGEEDREAFLAREGEGCPSCRETGYRGRVGLFELLTVTDSVRRLIGKCASASDIHASAEQSGLVSLARDGVGRILDGSTSVSEVLRVTMRKTV